MQPAQIADNILVLGAGQLGLSVLRGLAEHSRSRRVSRLNVMLPPLDGPPRPLSDRDRDLGRLGAEIIRTDLATATQKELVAIFGRFSTVICCTGFVAGPGTQRRITEAVLEAGVRRYVPWQFGVDYDAVGYGSGQAVWDEQLDVRRLLRTQASTRWIIVSTGMFTSFLFEPAFGIVDLRNGHVNALGSWDNQLTVTAPSDIGRLTAAILAHEPPLDNQVVFVAGDTFSYAELATIVEATLGRPVGRSLLDPQRLRFDLAARPDDQMLQYQLAFARDSGVAWPMQHTYNSQQGIPVIDLRAWLRTSGARPGSTVLTRSGDGAFAE